MFTGAMIHTYVGRYEGITTLSLSLSVEEQDPPEQVKITVWFSKSGLSMDPAGAPYSPLHMDSILYFCCALELMLGYGRGHEWALGATPCDLLEGWCVAGLVQGSVGG